MRRSCRVECRVAPSAVTVTSAPSAVSEAKHPKPLREAIDACRVSLLKQARCLMGSVRKKAAGQQHPAVATATAHCRTTTIFLGRRWRRSTPLRRVHRHYGPGCQAQVKRWATSEEQDRSRHHSAHRGGLELSTGTGLYGACRSTQCCMAVWSR